MAQNLKGKVALVTGGSSGIGLATAKRLVADGASVFITGRRQAELDEAVAQIGGDVTAVRADSSRLADLDRLYHTIRTSKGKLDVLFANAGILEKAPLGEITEDMVDRLLSVNVKGTIFTVQKALPLLADGASIILTSSVVANKGLPGGGSVYAATKAAIRSFARNWILDLKPRAIRVNVVSPGPIETPGLKGGAPEQVPADTYLAALASHVPVGRVGRPEEIADVVAYLASDASSFITGADIQADGGFAQI
ncbi:SDR family oxidoreductase [Rhizobium leguminosarum bv. viciae]|nr:SDR family oxidoreductase [Rhizobium leguminosarum bv. viciae]